jgi:hypothetical protein
MGPDKITAVNRVEVTVFAVKVQDLYVGKPLKRPTKAISRLSRPAGHATQLAGVARKVTDNQICFTQWVSPQNECFA